MVKKEYNPKAYNIIKEKIKDNPDLKNYEIFIKFSNQPFLFAKKAMKEDYSS